MCSFILGLYLSMKEMNEQKTDSTVNVNSTGKKADPSTLLTPSKVPFSSVNTEERLCRLSFGVI